MRQKTMRQKTLSTILIWQNTLREMPLRQSNTFTNVIRPNVEWRNEWGVAHTENWLKLKYTVLCDADTVRRVALHLHTFTSTDQ